MGLPLNWFFLLFCFAVSIISWTAVGNWYSDCPPKKRLPKPPKEIVLFTLVVSTLFTIVYMIGFYLPTWTYILYAILLLLAVIGGKKIPS